MNFFEYLFCRLYWWNTQIIKEKDIPVVYSITGLSVFHGFSIIPLYGLMHIFIFKSFYINDILGIDSFLLIGIIVFLIDYLYFKPKYPVLLKKFEKIPKEQKKKKDILCIVYIVTIIVVNVLFTIYFRSKNLGA
jgi:hypothetical protein